ncbi:undecaprenyl-phosphate glucose phosphotransferase [Marinilongibacter aquaticus]|uniref:undecaprenyl-phosphate glucose phosphotransferase n=1 Tax=Marinilongibacter aquaticus TaxID=2975157 RepID=UPI0021BD47C1|nr:undecaprenyl-phosphate glucose phosphotransferase [Marinilongibacter aquaticus]UBM58085.1 undecaprenyl-phosphate glucose phosphotransferase [Marinilongibacter aquaticus]
MFKRFNKIGYLKLFTDVIILLGSFLAASWLSHREIDRMDRVIVVSFIVAWYLSSKVTNLYEDFRTEKYVSELILVLQNILIQFIVAGQLFFMLDQHAHARVFVVWYLTLITLALIFKGYVTKKLLLIYRRRGGNFRNILFIGYNDVTNDLIESIIVNPHYGYKVKGVVCKEEMHTDDFSYLGDLHKFFNNGISQNIDDVIITSDEVNKEERNAILQFCEERAIRTKIIPNYNNFPPRSIRLSLFGGYPLISMRGEPLQDWHFRALKRAFDVVFSLLVCVLLFSWLFPIIALLIKLDSKGPVFFVQDRWGENGKKFRCMKFRSMRTDAKDVKQDGKFNQATKSDPRITKLGAFLRKSSIDELPQFFNVLKGDMSVVGPRPHAHEHNLQAKEEVDKYMIRHWVKPGITGWAQVNGYRGETKTTLMMQKRVNLDIWYLENWSFLLDIQIIIMTVYNAVKGEEMAY